MSMTKTIEIDGKQVPFKASAAIPRIYRVKYGRDIFKDLMKLEKALNENTAEEMICEIPGLKKGDRVLAERNGEVAEGIIANLFKARDFDMEEREYGRVIQKISMRFLS